MSVAVEKNHRNIIKALCFAGLFVIFTWGVSPWVTLGINISSSVDGYVFLVIKNKIPEKGQLVAFWPPENRFYKNSWFVKYVAGIPGDSVKWDKKMFYVNDSYLGVAKDISQNGLPLLPSVEGTVPENHFFVWTNHPDSFDSRYKDIGWISYESVIGRAIRIF